MPFSLFYDLKYHFQPLVRGSAVKKFELKGDSIS